MSEYEDLDEEEEKETDEGWLEYWLVVGGVSQKATRAIESVGGRVERLLCRGGLMLPLMYAVCLLYHDDDDDQGFSYHTDDGQKARQLFIASADAHHDLYIYCDDGSTPRFESNTTYLRIVTEAEWFALADKREGNKP